MTANGVPILVSRAFKKMLKFGLMGNDILKLLIVNGSRRMLLEKVLSLRHSVFLLPTNVIRKIPNIYVG